MIRLFLPLLIIASWCTACKVAVRPVPIWKNQSPSIHIPSEDFIFISADKNWEAMLMGFTQPIELIKKETKDGFILSVKNISGITEGPANLILKNRDSCFYFSLTLKNDTSGVLSSKEYRSPKTVNPDSSLQQHIMKHDINEWRELVKHPHEQEYFKETLINLGPMSGTFIAQAGNPLSSYYVQPGSVVNIPLRATYNSTEKTYLVSTGRLKDKYQNLVADGTLITYFFTDGTYQFQLESSTLNGLDTVSIPANNNSYILWASIHTMVSSKIVLNPK